MCMYKTVFAVLLCPVRRDKVKTFCSELDLAVRRLHAKASTCLLQTAPNLAAARDLQALLQLHCGGLGLQFKLCTSL